MAAVDEIINIVVMQVQDANGCQKVLEYLHVHDNLKPYCHHACM